MFVRDLSDGSAVDHVLLVRGVVPRGGPVLELTLGDRTGRVTATVSSEAEPLCRPGAPVRVTGYVAGTNGSRRIEVSSISPVAAEDVDLSVLLDGPPRSAERMEGDLRELIATVQCAALRELLDRVFGPGADTWATFRDAPGAKHFHHAYVHGLLEHSLTVAQGVSAISATFPGIDRDVAVAGALLHDIGKLDAYTRDPGAIALTDDGRLHGEIPMGYYRVRRLIEDVPGFPPQTAQHLLHIILSHHGQLEYGSPVRPATREATLVHFLDNLGGRLGSFDRIEKELATGASWSAFDKALGAGAFFGERRAA